MSQYDLPKSFIYSRHLPSLSHGGVIIMFPSEAQMESLSLAWVLYREGSGKYWSEVVKDYLWLFSRHYIMDYCKTNLKIFVILWFFNQKPYEHILHYVFLDLVIKFDSSDESNFVLKRISCNVRIHFHVMLLTSIFWIYHTVFSLVVRRMWM